MELQNIKVTVDMGDGIVWVYENIFSITANEFLAEENNPNSLIYKLIIDSSNVSVKKKNEQEKNIEKIIEKLDFLIDKTCNKSSCCKNTNNSN